MTDVAAETKDRDGGEAACAGPSNPHQEQMEQVAKTGIAPWAEQAIRRDERFRLASLLYEGKDTIAGFAGDKRQLVELVAFMLNLNGDV